ncbi:MAG: beta-ketoacyl-[acyl-carrier-protein] synthase family protein [Deltaproteobacteria bacterium]|nr:beta-ketoacyl-[acyl-carrier-protein] synthase family protein [Deltaproteobacteria bacterium]
MKEVVVTQMAALSAIGDSLHEMWEKLLEGRSAVRKIDRFSTEKLEFHSGASIPWLDSCESDNRIIELTRKLLNQSIAPPEKTYVIWAGIKGDTEYIEQKAEGTIKTSHFLASHYRRFACRALGIEENGMDLNAACASSTVALAIGAELIASGQQSSVLVCCADILSRFSFTGFAALRGLSATQCRPFDAQRDGLVLGDGAAAILLTHKETARDNNYPLLARLSGWGIANDANHITGPAKDARGLIKAISSATDQAGISRDQIEAYCAHGTGTVYNDAMELTAVESVYGSRKFPVFSVKGAIGHTLGAAGALEAALSVKSLAEKRVPPTAGFENHEERTAGRLSSSSRNFEGNCILTTNSGFGGCNAALIFEKV